MQLDDPALSATLLAPTDAAWQKLLLEMRVAPSQLFNETQLLSEILSYHVLPGDHGGSSVFDGQRLATLLMNATVEIAIPSPPNQMVPGAFVVPERGTPALVVTFDVLAPACASTAHIIDTVLLPPDVATELALMGS